MLFSEAWRWHSDSVIHAAVSVSDLLVLQPLAVPTLEDLEKLKQGRGEKTSTVMSSLGGAPASRRHGATTVDLAIAKAALLRVPARVMEDLVEWGRSRRRPGVADGYQLARVPPPIKRPDTARPRSLVQVGLGDSGARRRRPAPKRSTPGKECTVVFTAAPPCQDFSDWAGQPLPESRRLRAQGLLGGFCSPA